MNNSKIKVTVRKRPISKNEILKKETDIIECHEKNIMVKKNKIKYDLTKYIEKHEYIFDKVFSENNSNDYIFNDYIKFLVDNTFNGFKSSCFAYGQTGSGKTYTMMGDGKSKGLIKLSVENIFYRLSNHKGFHILISFYEIYCGKIYDLLQKRKVCNLLEDSKGNINIKGLNKLKILNYNSFIEKIESGLENRITTNTLGNYDSSRSHAIMNIEICSDINKTIGKISFIDLAGNERGADTYYNKKQTKLDGAEINKSLLALKECIRALDKEKDHIPFRGSKLTLVLKDCFVGKNCLSLMLCCVNPCSSCCELTLNTLRYADRVKELKNKKKNTTNKKHIEIQNTENLNFKDNSFYVNSTEKFNSEINISKIIDQKMDDFEINTSNINNLEKISFDDFSLKKEISEEINDKINEEIKHEIKEELNKKINEEMIEPIKEQMKEEINESIKILNNDNQLINSNNDIDKNLSILKTEKIKKMSKKSLENLILKKDKQIIKKHMKYIKSLISHAYKHYKLYNKNKEMIINDYYDNIKILIEENDLSKSDLENKWDKNKNLLDIYNE